MIFLADDYLEKYCNSFTYLLLTSYKRQYSFDCIQRIISYSKCMSEFEKSNVTIIAFDSYKRIYEEMFLEKTDNEELNPYDIFGWCGYAYIHLFLSLQITFEALFYVIPFEEMLSLYHLYHEMNITQLENYAKEKLKYSILHIIMKRWKMSNSVLSKKTGIAVSTINALRYKKRDIAKFEASKLLLIANALLVKIETLLPNIHLDLQQ